MIRKGVERVATPIMRIAVEKKNVLDNLKDL